MCDILAAISYGYGLHHQQERPMKRVKINMTIPSRPAPPPPQRSTAPPPSRYTPTTDWDFCTFDSGTGTDASTNRIPSRNDMPNIRHLQQNKTKKNPPPRPPPPKLSVTPAAPLKKPGQPQSINILSSLFGQKRSSNGTVANVATKPVGMANSSFPKSVPPSAASTVKLLPPPTSSSLTKAMGKSQHQPYSGAATHLNSTGYSAYGTNQSHTAPGTAELISFDSPPSSPTFTQKSCSDCISVDSFSSDSNYSSPNNGNMSQAESGFEDDFVASNRVGSCIPWVEPAAFDPFDASATSNAKRAPSAPPPNNYAPLTFASSSTAQIRRPLLNSKLQQVDFIDPLCNGRSALPKVATVSMPTIIKPVVAASGSGNQRSTPSHSATMLPSSGANSTMQSFDLTADAAEPEEDSVFDSLNRSPPMPSIPPPPPPALDTYTEEPYGIALYDFEGQSMEDLSFRANEKIYLLQRLNEEWYMGRDRRGLEGMFPVNYIEVQVPLTSSSSTKLAAEQSDAVVEGKAAGTQKVRVLYQFLAETTDDLTITENDLVTVLYQITPEWLYGELNGRRGQFPANFIEYVPPNLPQMPVSSAASSS